MAQNHTIIALALASIAAMSAPATAQADEFKTGTYQKGFGNTWAGGDVYAKVKVGRYRGVRPRDSHLAQMDLRGSLWFLRHRGDLVNLKVESRNEQRWVAPVRRVTWELKINGKKIKKVVASTDYTIARYKKVFKLFAKDPKVTYPVGPFTVTIKGNVGVGVDAAGSLSLTELRSAAARINADGSAWGQGSASAAFGIPGASVGVECVAKLLNTKLAAFVGAGQAKGLSGAVTFSIRAIEIKLKSFVKVLWKKFSKTLATWKSSAYTRYLIRIGTASTGSGSGSSGGSRSSSPPRRTARPQTRRNLHLR